MASLQPASRLRLPRAEAERRPAPLLRLQVRKEARVAVARERDQQIALMIAK